jgi:hypothetical protein
MIKKRELKCGLFSFKFILSYPTEQVDTDNFWCSIFIAIGCDVRGLFYHRIYPKKMPGYEAEGSDLIACYSAIILYK